MTLVTAEPAPSRRPSPPISASFAMAPITASLATAPISASLAIVSIGSGSKQARPGQVDRCVAPTPLQVVEHRAAMLRFARRKIRDEDLAEDAVQEALAAALSNPQSFHGQSTLRTWLIGILNHKIQDTFRREGRYVSINAIHDSDDENAESELDRIAFRRDPGYDDPSRQVARNRLGDALRAEIEALPATLKDVFSMQVLDGAETSEVCRALAITEANCWVRLHRARKRLSERMSAWLA